MSKNFSKADIPDIIDNFNKNIKRIVKILDSNIINNIAYDTLRRRLLIAMKETPIILLQQGGNMIYNQREYIINNNLDDLLNKDLNYHIQNIKVDESTKNEINEKEKEFSELFNIIQSNWIKFNDTEKKYVNKIFKTLLSEYSKYKSIN